MGSMDGRTLGSQEPFPLYETIRHNVQHCTLHCGYTINSCWSIRLLRIPSSLNHYACYSSIMYNSYILIPNRLYQGSLVSLFFAMTQPIIHPTLCVTHYKTNKRVRYSGSYACQMTVRGKWKHVTCINDALEAFDIGIQHTARMLREKWRIVEIATGKVLKTNAHQEYSGTSFVISEEVLGMSNIWRH